MKFAVLGLGRTGHTFSSYLIDKKQEMTAWDRDPSKAAIVAENGIECDGALNGLFRPRATADLAQAVDGAEYILVLTLAGGHRDVANGLRGKLRRGQTVIVFNSNWGAYEFHNILGEEAAAKDVVIAETGGMFLMSNLARPGRCTLRAVKKSMSLASIPAGKAEAVVAGLADIFPQLRPAANVLETSFNASNPILHAPITLFNLARMENGENYKYYMDGASPAVVRYIERIDAERLHVAKALGIEGESCLDIVNAAWGGSHTSLYEALRASYPNSVGPKSPDLDYRFITEDIPYGIAPIQILGQRFGVATPYIDALLTGYSLALDTDFPAQAPDFSAFSVEKLIRS